MYKEFDATQSVDECVAEDDRMGLIGALTGICYLDESFSTRMFDDGVEYATKVKGYAKLWEPIRDDPPLYASRVDSQDPLLSEADFARAVSHLQRNFCQERIDDLKKLGRYLFPAAKSASAVKPAEQTKPRPRAKSTHQEGSPSPFVAAVAIVAALIAVASFVLWLLKK